MEGNNVNYGLPGYTCIYCSAWIAYGVLHTCIPQQQYTWPSYPPDLVRVLGEIRDILRDIRDGKTPQPSANNVEKLLTSQVIT